MAGLEHAGFALMIFGAVVLLVIALVAGDWLFAALAAVVAASIGATWLLRRAHAARSRS